MNYEPVSGHFIKDDKGKRIAIVCGSDTYRLDVPLSGEELIEVFMNNGDVLPIMNQMPSYVTSTTP